MAWKLFKKLSYQDFKGKFHKYLTEWIDRNKYIIDTKKQTEGEKEEKEFYLMLAKPLHKNIVDKEREAREYSRQGGRMWNKGAFLYTDVNSDYMVQISQGFYTNPGLSG